MVKIDRAFDRNSLIEPNTKDQMYTPVTGAEDRALPYGYGIFTQEFLGKEVVWSYGQYDCFSTLYMKIPSDDLTLILMANNNLMSDPPRLIYGDLRYSLFALAFYKAYVDENHEGFEKRSLIFKKIWG